MGIKALPGSLQVIHSIENAKAFFCAANPSNHYIYRATMLNYTEMGGAFR